MALVIFCINSKLAPASATPSAADSPARAPPTTAAMALAPTNTTPKCRARRRARRTAAGATAGSSSRPGAAAPPAVGAELPARALVGSLPGSLLRSLLGIVIVVPLPPFALFVAFPLRFQVRGSGCSVYRSNARRNAKAEANDGEPWRRLEPRVQPAAPEQPDEHAERKLESERREAGQAFPVLLHFVVAARGRVPALPQWRGARPGPHICHRRTRWVVRTPTGKPDGRPCASISLTGRGALATDKVTGRRDEVLAPTARGGALNTRPERWSRRARPEAPRTGTAVGPRNARVERDVRAHSSAGPLTSPWAAVSVSPVPAWVHPTRPRREPQWPREPPPRAAPTTCRELRFETHGPGPLGFRR